MKWNTLFVTLTLLLTSSSSLADEKSALAEMQMIKEDVIEWTQALEKAQTSALQQLIEGLDNVSLEDGPQYETFRNFAEKIFDENKLGYNDAFKQYFDDIMFDVLEIPSRHFGESALVDDTPAARAQSDLLYLISKAGTHNAGFTAFTVSEMALFDARDGQDDAPVKKEALVKALKNKLEDLPKDFKYILK